MFLFFGVGNKKLCFLRFGKINNKCEIDKCLLLNECNNWFINWQSTDAV